MIATLRELKNHAWLIKAMSYLAQQGMAFECDFIGEAAGWEPGIEDRINALISRERLQDRVRLLGWQTTDNIVSAIDRASVVVLPSKSEGLGTVLPEAMARMRTPVATDLPVLREATGNGRFGVLSPLDDVEILAKQLVVAHQRTVTQPTILYAAREFVRDHFSPDRHVETLEQLYTAAVQGAHESPPCPLPKSSAS